MTWPASTRCCARSGAPIPGLPQSLLYCADPAVLGAHLLIMAYQPGLVIGGVMPSEIDPAQAGPVLSAHLVSLLADWAEHNIRVNAVTYGFFETYLTAKMVPHQHIAPRLQSRIPLGRFGQLSGWRAQSRSWPLMSPHTSRGTA